MELKETKHQICSKCGAIGEIISEAIYGCDNCKKKFINQLKLEIIIMDDDIDKMETYQFCCWKCVLEFLPKIKVNTYAISLPHLYYDKSIIDSKKQRLKMKGCMAKDFIKLITKIT